MREILQPTRDKKNKHSSSTPMSSWLGIWESVLPVSSASVHFHSEGILQVFLIFLSPYLWLMAIIKSFPLCLLVFSGCIIWLLNLWHLVLFCFLFGWGVKGREAWSADDHIVEGVPIANDQSNLYLTHLNAYLMVSVITPVCFHKQWLDPKRYQFYLISV